MVAISTITGVYEAVRRRFVPPFSLVGPSTQPTRKPGPNDPEGPNRFGVRLSLCSTDFAGGEGHFPHKFI